MNVLLTCAGRRNYLIEYFRQALKGEGKVFAADSSRSAPALQDADRSLVAPPVSAPDYIERIHAFCKAENVGLIVPLNDLELPVLARHREMFMRDKIFVHVSSPEVVELCFDKWQGFRFLQSLHLESPKTFLTLEQAREAVKNGRLSFPLVIKPRWGTASINIEYPQNFEELELAYRLGRIRLKNTIIGQVSEGDPERCLLIQECLKGEEYGLDVVNDLDGRYVTTFVKQKLSMRAGETDRAVTVPDETLQNIGKILGTALGHVGNLDCDVFFDGHTFRILEMNPRFGGGYPFSHVAGADLPAALLAWSRKLEPDPAWLRVRPNVASAKCDRLVSIGSEPQDSVPSFAVSPVEKGRAVSPSGSLVL